MANQKCTHPNLIPFECKFGKRTVREVDNEGNMELLIDWKSNISSAHLLRVTKYYCPVCKKIIPAPEE